MSPVKQKSLGRLVPTQATGVEYQVEYGIQFAVEVRQHGRAAAPPTDVRWTKCSVRSTRAHLIPAGNYFLHAEDGKIHQVKFTAGEWHYLERP
jgi:hypothetical protein